jgi:hypothetical protein
MSLSPTMWEHPNICIHVLSSLQPPRGASQHVTLAKKFKLMRCHPYRTVYEPTYADVHALSHFLLANRQELKNI